MENSYFKLDRSCERPTTMEVAFVLMTPELANEILANRNVGNRPFKKRFIDRMARDIEVGEYVVTHQGIAFNANGNLLDGQNRLAAIVLSGKPVILMVTYNVPPKAQTKMDIGIKRNDSELCAFVYKVRANNTITAIAKAMLNKGHGNLEIPTSDLAEFLEEHEEAIEFARKCSQNYKVGRVSPIQGVIARAYYHADASKLERFMLVMQRDPSAPAKAEEAAAAQFGKELESVRRNSRKDRIYQYACAQRALCNFLDNRPAKNTKPEYRNRFPLPSEEQDEAWRPSLSASVGGRP